MKKSTVILMWGIITSLAISAYSFMLYKSEMAFTHSGLAYVSFLIMFFGMMIAMIQFRNKVNGGFASFGQLYGIGIMVTLVISVISTIYFAVLLQLTPDYIDKLIAASQAQMINKGYSPDQIEMGMRGMKMFMSPPVLIISGLILYIILGAILGLLAAAITNKPKPFFEEDLTNIQ